MCLILVDNSNIFIEGQKCSAKRKGVIRAQGEDRQPIDPSWRINFASLLVELADNRAIYKSILVGSRPPPKDAVWTMARSSGFEVITHDRDFNNKEKAIDTEIVAQGTRAICRSPSPGVLVLASGDRDFIPLVKIAQDEGWTAEMVAFSSSFSSGGQMATTVDKIRHLDNCIERIGHHEFDWP